MNRILSATKFTIAWIAIVVLLAATLNYVKILLLYLSIQLIENDALRPTGWNTGTMAGVDKCLTVLFVILWLMGAMYSVTYIREALDANQFWGRMARVLGILGLVCLVSLGILSVAG